MCINRHTLGIAIFFPITEAIWELFSQGDIFKCYTLRDGRKWASGIHGLSLSSLISAGALDKQDFTSLMQWVRIKAFLSEAHWVFTHPFIVKVLFSHGQFVLRLLCLRLQQIASQPTVEDYKVQYVLYTLPSPPPPLSVRHFCGLFHHREIKELSYLRNSLYYAWLEKKKYKI